MSNIVSDKHAESAYDRELSDSNSPVRQLDEVAVKRLVRKTDMILMPALGTSKPYIQGLTWLLLRHHS